MSGKIRHANLETPRARSELKTGRQPHFRSLVQEQLHLGYHRQQPDRPGRWIVRIKKSKYQYHVAELGLADDCNRADERKFLSFKEAEKRALDYYFKSAITLASTEERVAEKYRAFLEQDITPLCFLYRHYAPDGDLLYVGISLHALARQNKHLHYAHWRTSIYKIVIEPFETREAALVAEGAAIKNEFPKFNTVHNGQRHPIHELSSLLIDETTTPPQVDPVDFLRTVRAVARGAKQRGSSSNFGGDA
jgi:hypothetical protein